MIPFMATSKFGKVFGEALIDPRPSSRVATALETAKRFGKYDSVS